MIGTIIEFTVQQSNHRPNHPFPRTERRETRNIIFCWVDYDVSLRSDVDENTARAGRVKRGANRRTDG